MSEQKSKHPIWLQGINGFFALAGVVNVAVGSFFLVKANPLPGSVAVAAGIVLILIATIDRFESVKGLGVHAELRKVDAKIAEADKIFDQMKRLSELTGSQIISLASKVGRMGTTPTIAELTEIAEAVKGTLQESGSSSERIRQALRPWAYMTALDLARRLFIPIQRSLTDKRDAVQEQKLAYERITPIPETSAITEFMQRIHALQRLELQPIHTLGSISIEQMTPFLKECVRDSPELDDGTRTSLIENISAWDDVFSSLADCNLSHDQKHRVVQFLDK